MKTELKACPWCGDAPNVDDEGSFVLTDGIKYGALRCCITGPEVRTDYKPVEHWKGAAIEAWNDRATPPSLSTAEVDERAEFEAWARPQLYWWNGQTYSDLHTQVAWEAWKSGRAALASRPAVEAGELPPLPATQPAPVALPNLVSVDEIEEAIKETEYPYFGKLDLNHKQHGAVDVLVRCAKSLLASLAPAAESVRQVPAGDFLPAREVADEIVLLSNVMREHPQLKSVIGREVLLMRCVRKALSRPGVEPQVLTATEVDTAMVKVLRDKADTDRAALATKPATSAPGAALDEAAAYRLWRDCEISEDAWFTEHLVSYLPANSYGRAPTAVEFDAAMAKVMRDRAENDRAALEANFRAGIQQTRATLCGEPGAGASAQKEE